MKILITGAYGQLGSELKELSVKYPEWDFLFTDIDSLDITDEDKVLESVLAENPGFIINCAAFTAVDKAETDEENAFRINALAPSFLSKAAKTVNAGFINISTDYVFNGEAFVPYTETDKEDPRSVYGRTKLEGERRSVKENPESVIIRTSWLYSSFGNNFVRTMLRLSAQNTSLKVVFDQIGTPTYAADLAGAVMSIVKTYESDRGKYIPGIYHYSNEGVASWYDFAMSIFEISGIPCQVVPVNSAEFPVIALRPPFSVLNKSKIKSKFGLEIPYWRDSLKICLHKLKQK
ncbi:MAG: dTDP-4-dehydrorhamnose reductase [Prolixibacteraceae bacterium]|nr:dTDP-4-dehydrorhamnose reductase [Prolixibacteraceae bacterium]